MAPNSNGFHASFQANALDELRRLVAFMNHSVTAAAAVAPTPIPTPIPTSTPTSTVFDGSLVRSPPVAWPGHASSPGENQRPPDPGDSTQTTTHCAGTPSYDEDDDECLSSNT